MKILAFLQNAWFKNPERMKQIRDRHYAGRREDFVRDFLFFGCLTGRRLRIAFGEELCDRIIWEEASERIGGKSTDSFPADPAHIRRAVAKHQPHIVLHFGRIAAEGLAKALPDLDQTVCCIPGPHPAARHATVVDELMETAARLRTAIEEMADAAAQYAKEDARHATQTTRVQGRRG